MIFQLTLLLGNKYLVFFSPLPFLPLFLGNREQSFWVTYVMAGFRNVWSKSLPLVLCNSVFTLQASIYAVIYWRIIVLVRELVLESGMSCC